MRLMKLVFSCLALALALGLGGCGSVVYERARFDGNRVSNPTLGRGVYYRIPAAYSVLNPRSPVPPKKENLEFEKYLRGFAATNDESGDNAFRETILFKAENRYLVLIHASVNIPGTFRRMPPQNRALLMQQFASFPYRFFQVPQSDFNYAFEQVAGRSAIAYKPFRTGLVDGGADWRGLGYTLLGDVTDIMHVMLFTRTADLAAAEADLKSIVSDFSYGKPSP